ncbi:MAG: hypothetical protein ACI9EF_003028 [Pseudohongiellaceae bacterium]|jgi:hypothetical protein
MAGNSQVYGQNCLFKGGSGGGGAGERFPGADGMPALIMFGSAPNSPVMSERNCQFIGGLGGNGTCSQPHGSDAADIVTNAGTLVTLAGTPRSYGSTAPTREGESVTLSFEGELGDLVALLLAPTWMPGLSVGPSGKVLHLPMPFLIFELGTVPRSGNLEVSLPTGELGAGIDVLAVPSQALFLGTNGSLSWSGASLPVLLDV